MSRLVIIHVLTLDFVLSHRIVATDSSEGAMSSQQRPLDSRRSMSKHWIERMVQSLPDEFKGYAKWPLKFVEGLVYCFDGDDKVWEPFMLSHGKPIVSGYHFLYRRSNSGLPTNSLLANLLIEGNA